jgi:hypothetical protein
MDNPLASDGSLHESAHPSKQQRHQSIAGVRAQSKPPSSKNKEKEKKNPVSDNLSLLNKLLDSLNLKAKDIDLSLMAVEEDDDGEQYWILGDENILDQISSKVHIKDLEGEKEQNHAQRPKKTQKHEDL